MNVDGRRVQIFVAVARHRSFSRASSELNIAQPWLSAQVRHLERQLGFPLFFRNTRRISLTPEGEILLPHAENLVASQGLFGNQAAAIGRGVAGTLRFGVPPYSEQFPERAQIYESFERTHPGIVIENESGWSPLLRRRVLEGELDVAFSIGDRTEQGLDSRLVATCCSKLYMRADDPLVRLTVIPIASLRLRTIVGFPRRTNPGLYDRMFGRLLDCGVEIGFVADTGMEGVTRNILRTGNLAISFQQPNFERSDIEVRDLEPSSAPFELYVIRRAECKLPLIQAFWNIAGKSGGRKRM